MRVFKRRAVRSLRLELEGGYHLASIHRAAEKAYSRKPGFQYVGAMLLASLLVEGIKYGLMVLG